MEVSSILLINPLHAESMLQLGNLHPPLGLAYIASSLERNGYLVNILDMSKRRITLSFLKDYLSRVAPRIVGITCVTSTYTSALRIASIVKKVYENVLVVIGGPHVTFTSERVFRDTDNVDVVVRGEGELTMTELVNSFYNRSKFSDVKGITYRDRFKNVKNTHARPLIQKLNDLPFPAYHLLPTQEYCKDESLYVMTSRGCPFKCKFCVVPRMWGGRIRFRTPKNVVDEVKMLVKEYNYTGKELGFLDDLFTLNHRRVYQICEELIKQKIDVRWRCQSRTDTVNRKLLEKMKKAGCYKVCFGVESGSKRTLLRLNKGIGLSRTKRTVNLCKEVGLKVATYFMIGFPWETKEDVMKTINLALELNADEYGLAFFTPYPGTDYYEDLRLSGIDFSNEEFEKFNTFTPIIETKNLSKNKLLDAYDFFLRNLIDQ